VVVFVFQVTTFDYIHLPGGVIHLPSVFIHLPGVDIHLPGVGIHLPGVDIHLPHTDILTFILDTEGSSSRCLNSFSR